MFASDQGREELSAHKDRYVRHISAQFFLCKRLEDLADTLPEDVDIRECLLISRSVVPLLSRAHRFEEENIFPELILAYAEDDAVPLLIDRLRREHREDEGHARELKEDLARFVTERENCDIGSLAYMMRGFFRGVRRHVAFERDFLLPLMAAQQSEN